MAVVVGSTGVYYCGYGSLVSSRVRLNRRLPANFSPSLERFFRRKRVSATMSLDSVRVAATMSLDSLNELYAIAASQTPDSFYSLAEEVTDGPIELPPELLDPLAIPEASPLQVAASVVLTGLITVLLFRSIRRRSQRAKAMKFRSTGVDKLDVKDAARKSAAELLNKSPEVPTPPPNALQTLSGAAVAGAIALVLYKFTTIVEGGFSGKPVSMNYSIRNLTITVRTIITGICYLATFVFAANSLGLTLLSLQLALNLGGSDAPPNPSPGDGEPELEKPSEDDSS